MGEKKVDILRFLEGVGDYCLEVFKTLTTPKVSGGAI
jgi:hypothetical protein